MITNMVYSSRDLTELVVYKGFHNGYMESRTPGKSSASQFSTNERLDAVLYEIEEDSSMRVRIVNHSNGIFKKMVHCILQVEGP